jgi:hypothetical protein
LRKAIAGSRSLLRDPVMPVEQAGATAQ